MKRSRFGLAASLCAAGLIVFAALFAARHLGLLQALELRVYDWQTTLVAPARRGEDPYVVLIGIDELDIRRLGRWPLTDRVLADVLEKIVGLGPAAVGVDLYRDLAIPDQPGNEVDPGTTRLREVLAAHSEIIAVSKFDDAEGLTIPGPDVLDGTGRTGFNDVLVDDDGTVRRGMLLLDAEGRESSFAFSLILAANYLAPRGIEVRNDPEDEDLMRIGDIRIPRFKENDGGYIGADANGYQYIVNYADRENVLPTYRLSALLEGRVPVASVAGKIVLLGSTADSVKDLFYLPTSSGQKGSTAVQGVILHGLLASQLARTGLGESSSISSLSEDAETAWILLLCLLGAVAGRWSRSPIRMTVVVVIGAAAVFVSGLFALQQALWIPVVPPVLGWVGATALVTALSLQREGQDRQYLRSLFDSSVSPEVAELLWQNRDQLLAQGHLKAEALTVTVLFSDLKNFTSVGERLEPEALIAWLNEYLEIMVPLVFAHGGLIVQFVGDALLVVFGAPIPRTEQSDIDADAASAVRCALDMQNALVELNKDLVQRDLPPLGMRVGILTGPAVGGSVGTRQRIEYNVQGDTINTASRLENYDKESFEPDYFSNPCRILIGEETLQRLHGKIEVEAVGELSFRGKDQKLKVSRVSSFRE